MLVKIDYQKTAEAFRKAPEIMARELRRELMRSLETVSEYAAKHHRFKSSGKPKSIEQSIQWDVGSGGIQGEVYLDEGIAKHGPYIHNGTGLYGPRRQIIKIKAKDRKALYWVSGGKKHFAKSVKINGIHPDKFLYRAMRINKKNITENFGRAIDRGIAAAGVK